MAARKKATRKKAAPKLPAKNKPSWMTDIQWRQEKEFEARREKRRAAEVRKNIREADKNLRPNKAQRARILKSYAELGVVLTDEELVRRLNKQRKELGLPPMAKSKRKKAARKKTTRKKVARKKATKRKPVRRKVARKSPTRKKTVRKATRKKVSRKKALKREPRVTADDIIKGRVKL